MLNLNQKESYSSCGTKATRLAKLAILPLLALALAACQSASPSPQQPTAVSVSVITASTEKLAMTTELPGRTQAYLVAEIRPQVNGLIQKRVFEEGSEVKAGSILYQIDPAPYRAAYDQAVAAVAVAEAKIPPAKARVERFKSLVAIHAVGQQDYDDAVSALQTAEAGAASAKAAMETARINLEYTLIKSPITGRIGRSSVTVGALVNAYQGVPLAVVQQLDPIYVDVIEASADILRLEKSMESGLLRQDKEATRKVKLILEDGSVYPLEGTLQFRDITVDQSTGSVTLRAVFPNPDKILLPGMFVQAVIEEGVNDQAILLPQQCISRDNKGNPFTWVVGQDGKAEMRFLQLDRAIGDKWLVTKGIAPGEQIIYEGALKLRPGTAVKAVAVTQAGA
ncbi:MAG TPA: efflux RND transporter periplasmic adaptor subunit [Candidatus Saccharicenans sp.]|nr:efflux RND transporter periplasmic adaptor subunit [Candidatus Saccharicenans sp.]HQM74033.1 efflux RND transporter periplasmic adaptor subunit [Candidatus Saccharicenans sp.]